MNKLFLWSYFGNSLKLNKGNLLYQNKLLRLSNCHLKMMEELSFQNVIKLVLPSKYMSLFS